jgi:hypothetical protein
MGRDFDVKVESTKTGEKKEIIAEDCDVENKSMLARLGIGKVDETLKCKGFRVRED